MFFLPCRREHQDKDNRGLVVLEASKNSTHSKTHSLSQSRSQRGSKRNLSSPARRNNNGGLVFLLGKRGSQKALKPQPHPPQQPHQLTEPSSPTEEVEQASTTFLSEDGTLSEKDCLSDKSLLLGDDVDNEVEIDFTLRDNADTGYLDRWLNSVLDSAHSGTIPTTPTRGRSPRPQLVDTDTVASGGRLDSLLESLSQQSLQNDSVSSEADEETPSYLGKDPDTSPPADTTLLNGGWAHLGDVEIHDTGASPTPERAASDTAVSTRKTHRLDSLLASLSKQPSRSSLLDDQEEPQETASSALGPPISDNRMPIDSQEPKPGLCSELETRSFSELETTTPAFWDFQELMRRKSIEFPLDFSDSSSVAADIEQLWLEEHDSWNNSVPSAAASMYSSSTECSASSSPLATTTSPLLASAAVRDKAVEESRIPSLVCKDEEPPAKPQEESPLNAAPKKTASSRTPSTPEKLDKETEFTFRARPVPKSTYQAKSSTPPLRDNRKEKTPTVKTPKVFSKTQPSWTTPKQKTTTSEAKRSSRKATASEKPNDRQKEFTFKARPVPKSTYQEPARHIRPKTPTQPTPTKKVDTSTPLFKARPVPASTYAAPRRTPSPRRSRTMSPQRRKENPSPLFKARPVPKSTFAHHKPIPRHASKESTTPTKPRQHSVTKQ